MSDILYIVMPAYNEADNINAVVEQWHPIVEKIGNGSKLVIFNDGSKDNTYQKMQELAEKYPCFIAETKPNSGHGATCLYAYRYAIEKNADFIFQTDSDGQTDPDEFWKFWEHRHQYDLGIGIRNARQDGFSRVVVTKTLRFIVWCIFGVWVKDANTPFRLMKRENLINYLAIIPENFFLANVVLSVISAKKKEKIFWCPITFKPRQAGVNSINIKRIIKIGFKALKDFRTINKQLKKS
ncbi:MAG: glycosyltransferase family 2 protein [Lentimicrobiaceae bacterium]|nr:glycosyltransferase family 2 protein [Lentimicrobiaceae bacterium]